MGTMYVSTSIVSSPVATPLQQYLPCCLTMAITKANATDPQSGQPPQVRVLATICDGCLGHVLDLWARNLSASPLVQQHSCQCASHTPTKYIINNGFPIVQKIPGPKGNKSFIGLSWEGHQLPHAHQTEPLTNKQCANFL